jgi:hypothetical protein
MNNYKDFIAECRPGHIQGIGGINCRHSWSPVSESQPYAYTPEQLAELNKRAAETKPWTFKNRKGEEVTKHFTEYDATQKMRNYENKMRMTRSSAAALKEVGQMDDYRDLKARYYRQLEQYKKFAAHFNLKTQMERVYADGLGRI